MAPHIRPQQEQDSEKVQQLLRDVFSRRTRSPLTKEPKELLDDAIRRGSPALALALVAESDERLLGYLALSRVELSDNTPDWYALGPLAIHPDMRRQGIGSQLVSEGMIRLYEMGANGCVVIGEPAFYRRFGFDSTPDLVVEGIPLEYFLARSFTEAGARSRGMVVYNPVFFNFVFFPERETNRSGIPPTS